MANQTDAPNSGSAPTDRPWPILRSLKSWRPQYISSDLVAGLTLVAIAIPEHAAPIRPLHRSSPARWR
jgi:hypothetical protein